MYFKIVIDQIALNEKSGYNMMLIFVHDITNDILKH